MKNQLLASLLFVTACSSVESPDEVPMPTPELGVSAAESTRVIRDRAVSVPVEIVRNEDVVGPVTIEVDGLPAGVTALPLQIAEGETTGTLKLLADTQIALGTNAKITVRAIAGETVAATAMMLRLTDRPGALDTTFSSDGISTAHYSTIHSELMTHVALQPDGKILAAGKNIDLDILMVTRFNADGSLDKDFSDGGMFPGPSTFEAVVGLTVRPDGSILLVCYEGSKTKLRVLSSSGYLIQTIELPAATDFAARSMVAMPDGSLYLSGVRDSKATAAVLRLDANLAIDDTFDGDGIAEVDFGGFPEVRNLMRRVDGRLVITGWAAAPNANGRYAAARFNADGSLDTTFSGDGFERYDMLPEGGLWTASLLPDGRVAAMTRDSNENVSKVVIEEDGSIDMGKAVSMFVVPFTSIAVSTGVFAVGASWSASDWAAIKVTSDGAIDSGFGQDGVSQLHMPSGGAHALYNAVQFDADRAFAIGGHSPSSAPSDQVLVRIWL